MHFEHKSMRTAVLGAVVELEQIHLQVLCIGRMNEELGNISFGARKPSTHNLA